MSVTTEKVIVQVSVDGQVTLVSSVSSALGAASSAAVAQAAAAAALVSETNADASEAAAAVSAAAALVSEGNADTSEANAAASAAAALVSEGNADASAGAAATSASDALTSANNADVSEAAAAASADAALVSQNAAAASAAAAATATETLVEGGTLDASFASIKSSGDIVLAGTKKFYVDGVGGVGGDTYISESSANVLDFYAGGVNTAKLTASGVTVTGTLKVGSGSTTSTGLIAGYLGTSGYGALWSTAVTPTNSNHAFAAGATATGVNAATSIALNIGNVNVGLVTSAGVNITGTIGVGIAPNASIGVYERATLTGLSTYAFAYDNLIGAGTTTAAYGAYMRPTCGTGVFTLANYYGYWAGDIQKGAGPTITNQYGLYVEALTNAGTNIGIRSLVTAGASNWNLYLDGTAKNYLGGDLALAATKKHYLDGASGAGGDTYLVESSANVLDTYVGGVNTLKSTPILTTVTGALSAPDLTVTVVDKTIFSATIVDTFLYDTSKDSDGGAWRHRCAHTSWYNETLSGNWLGSAANEAAARAISGATTGSYYYDTTAAGFYTLNAGSGKTATYRGNVRQFPAQVLITVEAARVVLWDLTQAGCPMWMAFDTTYAATPRIFVAPAGYPATSAVALNGNVALGAPTYGMTWVNFVADTGYRINATAMYKYKSNVAARNTETGHSQVSTAVIVNATVNDVAMTVLPNAPVDVATGLPVPTIAVATSGGVSVIQNDGTVTSKTITQLWSATAAASYFVSFIAFLSTNHLVFNYRLSGNGGHAEITVADTSLTVIARYGSDYANTTTQLDSIINSTIDKTNKIAVRKSVIAVNRGLQGGSDLGIGLVHSNFASPSKGMVAYVTKDYNSGWQVGAIKGAWLADTVAETLTGTELVTNGGLTVNATGWTTLNGAGLAHGANGVTITNAGATYGGIYQALAGLTVGKKYTVTMKVTGCYGVPARWGVPDTIPTTASGIGETTVDATLIHTFTATATTHYLVVGNRNDSGGYNTFGSISLRPADVDRSVKAKGLQAFGSLTKSAVASGAALMGYSGFSAANYLEQPYNSDLDFGTGDFCIMGWLSEAPNSANEIVFMRGFYSGGWSGAGIQFYIASTGVLAFQISDDGFATVDVINSTAAVDDGVPRLLTLCRRGANIEMWINDAKGGADATVTNAAGSLSNASATLMLGRQQDTSTPYPLTNGTMALWRTAAYAPTAEQIKHIYETEKALFQANAACTLAGSSNAVTALAYDDETDLLHVGTSYGRSAFKGLVRVSSEATAIGSITALAASGGFIAQGGATGADIYVPAYTLREELLRSAEQIAKMGSTLEPIWTTATASQTAFQMNVGWQPKYVYRNGLVLREGATEDYSISFDGFRWTVTLADASIVGDNICIMGVRTNG